MRRRRHHSIAVCQQGLQVHDFQEYQKHLREDGDFTLYTSRALTETNLRAYHLHRPFCFVITAKDDGRMIGFCGFYPDGNIHKDNDLGHAGSLSFLGRGEQTVWLSLLFYWRLCYLGSQKCEEINPNWAFYFSKRLDPYLSKELRNKDGSPLLFVSSVSDELFSKPKIGGISYDWKAAIGVIDASCKNISINRLKTAIAKFEKICQFETVVI